MRFQFRILPRTLRFKQAARTSRGCYLERRVWYVAVRDLMQEGSIGLGECAPLPDLSCDASPFYAQRLRQFCDEIEATGQVPYEALRPYPSMLFGIETALRSCQGSVERGDFRLLWDNDFSHSRAGLVTNGLIWMGTYEEMAARIEEKLQAGFTCVKLKIGALDFETECDLLRRIRARFSAADVCLRVDANGAFTPEEAPARLEALAKFQLHSIEQPLRAGQWDEMAHLCRQTPVPIALDEELIGVNEPQLKENLLRTIRPQYLVLKPSLHGGLRGAEEWIRFAQAQEIPFWTTSALESNVGLNALAQWTYEQHPSRPQGLGTGALFVQNYDRIPLEMRGESLWYGTERQTSFQQDVDAWLAQWDNTSQERFTFHTSGTTGVPKAIERTRAQIQASAEGTHVGVFGHRDVTGRTALLCLPMQYVAGAMMAARCRILGLRPVVCAPSSDPYASLTQAPFFAALTPMQAARIWEHPRSRRLFCATPYIIIGGGAVPASLAERFAPLRNCIFSTYAMTETLTHVALRRLSAGADGLQPERAYTPLPGIAVSLNADGHLCIQAPSLCDDFLTTNDLAEIHADGTFTLLGRADRTICSGGLKFQAEALEALLEPLALQEVLIYGAPHATLGECVALRYVGAPTEEEVLAFCRIAFPRHAVPRRIERVAALEKTLTGKIKL